MAIVSRQQWLSERMALLRREKTVTRELDQLAKARQALPWVKIDQNYTLQSSVGGHDFAELFGDYSQLIVYHFMFGPQWQQPCDGCSAWADAFNGTLSQIHRHDARLIVVSRASVAQIEQVLQIRGWDFPWYSSQYSSFNSDFHMSAELGVSSQTVGDEVIAYDRGESGGINVFVKNQQGIFHSYSCYNRGIQQMNGAYGFVDLLPYGGN